MLDSYVTMHQMVDCFNFIILLINIWMIECWIDSYIYLTGCQALRRFEQQKKDEEIARQYARTLANVTQDTSAA